MDFREIYPFMNSESYLNRIEQYVTKNELSDADAVLLQKFIFFRLATESISSKRSLKIAGTLCLWRSRYLNCDFANITDDQWIVSAGLIRMANLSQNTKRDYIMISRSFLSWLQEEGFNMNLTFAGIRKVKSIPAQKITKTPDMLVTDEEVVSMLQHPQCRPMTAALLAVLYYTGMRPSEAMRLRWRDLEFASPLLKFRISDTKTGKFRYAPTSEALEYVANWRKHYPKEIPGGPEGDNPVFISKVFSKSEPCGGYTSLCWAAARKQAVSLSKSALGKKVNLYVYRASDITNSAAKGVPDSVNKAVHWGNQSTTMLSTYLLLKDTQIEEALLKRAGLEIKEKSTDETMSKNILCNNCYTMNAPGSDYCKSCGKPLSKVAIKKQIDEMNYQEQEKKTMATLINDVAQIFGMSAEEFTYKIMKIKSLDKI